MAHQWPTFSTALLTGYLLTSHLVKPEAVWFIHPREPPSTLLQTENIHHSDPKHDS